VLIDSEHAAKFFNNLKNRIISDHQLRPTLWHFYRNVTMVLPSCVWLVADIYYGAIWQPKYNLF